MISLTGKISYFGGPDDSGVGPAEGLALLELSDLTSWRYRHLFLAPSMWDNGKGLARNLNPNALYCAMRWNEVGVDHSTARNAMVKVIASSGVHIWVQPCDYGPGDGKVVDGQQDQDTGRLIDLSPGAVKSLGLQTDDNVTCEIYP